MQPDHMKVCLWLDFYGPLLTERSREVLDLYYACDLSLAEIAENLQISRQAVHDKVRLGVRSLADYEAKLGLAEHYQTLKTSLQQARTALEQADLDEARAFVRQAEELL